MERFIADYPSSPRRAQALADLGLAYLNLGDKEKSLKYYDMVVETAPQSSEAKGAMQGIREISCLGRQGRRLVSIMPPGWAWRAT
ncbi:MAG: tetratricopeptide repeat protein [Alistipes onderdonkii]